MRLTLRTMLAYLDDCLEPSDAEQINKKIDEHEFASNLVLRIRNSMRRLRLGAPPLEGKGMGIDPNTVAEYLDNTLPQERIPDFERICLESDVHLAEVASCHQVLTLVLGKPVEISPNLRQRMYHLPETRARAEAAGAAETAATAVVSAGTGPAAAAAAAGEIPDESPLADAEKPVRKEQATVPDYLREARRPNFWPLLLTLMLAFLLAAVALRAMGEFDRDHPLLRLVAGAPETTVAQQDDARLTDDMAQGEAESSAMPGDRPVGDAATRREATSNGVTPNGVTQPMEQLDVPLAVPPDVIAADGSTAQPPVIPAGGASAAQPALPAETGAVAPAGDEPAPMPDPALPTVPAPPAPPATAGVVPTDAPAPVTDDRVAEAIGVRRPAAGADERAPGNGQPMPPETTDAASEPPASGKPPGRAASEPAVEVGRLLSEDQPLIRRDINSDVWSRLMPRALLASGDRLVALPALRPQVLLSPAVQLELVGPTTVQLARPESDEASSLVVEHGRLWLLAVGRPEMRVHLAFGDREGVLTLKSADALIAVEVWNYLPPGSDPESVSATKVARFYGVEGQAEWQELGGEEALSLERGTVAGFAGTRPVQVDQDSRMPAWMTGIDLSATERLDRLAAPNLIPAIGSDRPVQLSLLEKVNDRRQEVRSLAVRSLAYLNDFDRFFAFNDGVMRDDAQRSYWEAHFQSLRQALARGPEPAAELRRILEKYRPGKAEELYRMLWGYSPEQLEPAQGEAAKLVEYLDHEDLDFRILAFENLHAITGRTQEYSPQKTAAQRKASVRVWQDRLKEGLVVYKELPTPLPKLPAAAP